MACIFRNSRVVSGPVLLLLIVRSETVLASSPAAEMVETASRAVMLIAGVVGLLVLLPLAFFVYRKVFATIQVEKEARRDPEKDIARLEKRGEFGAAAALCAAGGDHKRAAALYGKAQDHGAAAEQFELAGDFKAAAGLFLRSGGSVRAASLFIKTGDYMEAARIFRNKGDHLRAAQSLELFGNKAAAAREFFSAGRFDRAARLFKEEELYADAADAYGRFLHGRELNKETMGQFYGHAGLLARTGRSDEAADIYRRILKIKGDYRKARNNLKALGCLEAGPNTSQTSPAAGDRSSPPPVTSVPAPSGGGAIDEGDALSPEGPDGIKRHTTLRNMITYGRLDPRYSMKIWVHILKAVAVRHTDNIFSGSFSPDEIRIDMQNSVTILAAEATYATYTAPEVLAGQAPGPHSDVYALGVILYEMITGSLEGLGHTRPSEKRDDVPPWLDGLVIGCTKKDRRDRYMNLEQVMEELVRLRNGPVP